jgi:hypothetical protein
LSNEELLTIAHAILIRCKQTGQDCIEIAKAVNAIEASKTEAETLFAFAVLAAEIEDFEYLEKKKWR